MKIKQQNLILPCTNSFLSASYKHPFYTQTHKYIHYGWDITSPTSGKKENIYSSGYGRVLKIGRDSNVGNVIIIKYYNVYNRNTKKCSDLIARYMHLSSINATPNQELKPGSYLGITGGTGRKENSYGVHLHIEFDTDTTYPYNSGQVKGGSIIKAGIANTMIDPKYVLNIGDSQNLGVNTEYIPMYYKEDLCLPKVKHDNAIKEIIKPLTSNSQKLILPINKCYITASKGMKAYLQRFGFSHFGVDLISYDGNNTVYASGDGKVLGVGVDNILGKCCIVLYKNAANHLTGKVHDVVFRYFHASNVLVKIGQTVDTNTKLLLYGNTGKYSTGAHLHLSCDLDTKNFKYEAGLAKDGTYIKPGTSSTMVNPFEFLHCKDSSPDNQVILGDTDSKYQGNLYVNLDDLGIPHLK